MASGFLRRVSAWRSTACECGGNDRAISWRCARRRGGSQKGAENRPERPRKDRVADARRDDETIITETPPLYSCYGHIGEQVRVPITGNRSKRILHGAINVNSGDVSLLITKEWVNETHQAFLSMIRSHWRGWNVVLFEDRASQHKSPE